MATFKTISFSKSESRLSDDQFSTKAEKMVQKCCHSEDNNQARDLLLKNIFIICRKSIEKYLMILHFDNDFLKLPEWHYKL